MAREEGSTLGARRREPEDWTCTQEQDCQIIQVRGVYGLWEDVSNVRAHCRRDRAISSFLLGRMFFEKLPEVFCCLGCTRHPPCAEVPLRRNTHSWIMMRFTVRWSCANSLVGDVFGAWSTSHHMSFSLRHKDRHRSIWSAATRVDIGFVMKHLAIMLRRAFMRAEFQTPLHFRRVCSLASLPG